MSQLDGAVFFESFVLSLSFTLASKRKMLGEKEVSMIRSAHAPLNIKAQNMFRGKWNFIKNFTLLTSLEGIALENNV
jgi:hypothetical protein